MRAPESSAAASEANQLKANSSVDDDRAGALFPAERRTLEMIHREGRRGADADQTLMSSTFLRNLRGECLPSLMG